MRRIPHFKDLSTFENDHFKVISYNGKNQHNTLLWNCICKHCNSECVKTSSQLLNNKTNSCGCMKKQWHNEQIRKYNTYKIISDSEVIVYTTNNNKIEEFICDLDDWNDMKDFYWYYHHTGYIYTKYDNKEYSYHRTILGLGNFNKTARVDHIDGNPLNNRKSNLRVVTHQQNTMNHKIRDDNTSEITGIHYNKTNGKWIARIGFENKRIVLGSFNSINEATRVRREAEIKYFGEYRRKTT